MKHLEYYQEWQPALAGLSTDVPGSGNKSLEDDAIKKYRQTVADLDYSSYDQLQAGKMNNYSLYALVLLFSDACAKVSDALKRNDFTREVLRAILLATTKVTPAHQQMVQSLTTTFVNNLSNLHGITNQFNAIARTLIAQTPAISVDSDAVVYTLWSCIFSLWQPY